MFDHAKVVPGARGRRLNGANACGRYVLWSAGRCGPASNCADESTL